MNPKYLLGVILILQVASVDVLALANEYFYEFGNRDVGDPIYTKEGSINCLLSHNNYITIPVNEEITYISVRVTAINPPKVDYDSQTKTIAIKYSFLEITYSTYKIFVKGISLKPKYK